jgi:hypothetical protein
MIEETTAPTLRRVDSRIRINWHDSKVSVTSGERQARDYG